MRKIKSTKGKVNKLPNSLYVEGQRYTNAPEKLSLDASGNDTLPSFRTTEPEVDERIANVEAEKGETVLKPDMSFLKISGDKHSKGGTNLLLPPGSFIFSDRIKVKGATVKPMFNWVNAKKKYTMADLSKKFSDMNKYLAILQDEKSDDYDRKTAEIMIQNYTQKLGQIAEIQEGIKSVDSAVMAYGGTVKYKYPWGTSRYGVPPTNPPDKTGKWAGDRRKSRNPKTGLMSSNWNAMTRYSSPEEYAKAVGYTGDPTNIKAMQKWIGEKYPDLVAKYHSDSEYGQPIGGTYDGKLGVRWEAIADEIGGGQRPVRPSTNFYDPTPGKVTPAPNPFTDDQFEQSPNNLNFQTDNSSPMISRQDWMYTIGPAAMNAASIKKYYPTRYQNYGLQQAQGIIANQRPLDYSSRITEVKKAAGEAYKANNAFARSGAQAASANALIGSQAASQANQIKGDEYNANVIRYDQGMQQIANLTTAIGEDQMKNAMLYNNSVAALDQNYREDVQRARNVLLGSIGQAESNALTTYALNKFNPNYKINPWNLNIGFKPGVNPFNLSGSGSGQGASIYNLAKNQKDKLKRENAGLSEKEAWDLALSMIRQRPSNYSDDLYPNRVFPGRLDGD